MEAHIHPHLSPLQLNRYFIKKLRFSLNEGFDRRGTPTNKELRATVMPQMSVLVDAEQNPDNDLQWRLELTVELDDSEDRSFPYKVAATVVGYFELDKKTPKAEAEDLAKVSGASILYSTAREVIANATSRTHYPRLMLPTVTFFDLPHQLEAQPLPQKATRKSATKKARKRAASPAAKKK
jgi:preprotein translocase subunit SecB